MVDPESVRIEVAFKGGPGLSALVTVEGADELERALAEGQQSAYRLDSNDGRYTIVLASVVYVKRFAKEARVGFGI